MTTYTVRKYDLRRGIETIAVMTAESADDLLPTQAVASKTRRWQRSPSAADRDNVHVQFDPRGLAGVAVMRADVEPAQAEHRNDVAVARAWVAAGRAPDTALRGSRI